MRGTRRASAEGCSTTATAGANAALPPDSADLDADGDTDEPIPLDLDGGSRSTDGNGDAVAVVDIGAFEVSAGACPWDLDATGDVGAADLLALLSHFGPCQA